MAKIGLHLLSQAEQEQIHAASLDLLQDVGMRIVDAEAQEILAGSGAKLDPEEQCVRFPPHLVEDALSKAPSEIRLYGRDIESSVLLEPGSIYYSTSGYALYLYDPETRTRRLMSQDDLAWVTRLADAMDQVDIYALLATPHDAPSETNDRYQLALALCNTTKHLWNTAYGKEGVLDAVRMAVAVRGGQDALRQFPLLTLDLTTLSPLQLDPRQTSTMIEGARQGLPIGISPGPIGGATGPVTLAGILTQANAEVLGAITLCQMVSSGIPVIYTQWTRVLDMEKGCVTMGGPEFSLLRIATAEMAQYYHLPSRGGGMIADAKAVDAQMGAEKMLNCLTASLAGLNIVAGLGQADFTNTVRPDLMAIDNEIVRVVRRMCQGMRVEGETIAKSVIEGVGPGGNFLTHDHTAAHFRDELWFPTLWDRNIWSLWESEGGLEVGQRAWQQLRDLEHRVPPLEENVQETIWSVVQEADRRVGEVG